MTERLVVIGGGAAGMSAASAARRVDSDLEIVVLEASGFAAWGMCGIPYFVAGMVGDAQELISITPEEFRRRRRIDLRFHSRVTEIDADGHAVTVESGGRIDRLTYSKLVVAAGATPVVPPVPGIDGPRVHLIRSLEGAIALRALVASGQVPRALVVGAGYVGLEMAEALVEAGIEVTVAERLPRVMPTIDREMADLVEAETRAHVELRLGGGLAELADDQATFDDGTVDRFDVVVVAAGIRAASREAAAAGATITETGALAVDDHMRTSLQDVLAAGDCVAVHHIVLGGPAHVALGPTANKTGRVAGMVAAGAESRFDGIVGTAVAKVFDLTVARTGLTVEEATQAGFEALSADSVAGSKARYYPGAAPTHSRLVFTPTGRLLGAQMVSRDPATAKRIDVIATALHAGFDVDRLGSLDLSYAPPFAPVYDPVLRVAQAAAKQIA